MVTSDQESNHEKFSEMTRILFDRDLQADENFTFNETDTSTTPAPTPWGGGPSAAPPTTPAPIPSSNTNNDDDGKGGIPLKFLIVVVLLVLAALVIYKIYQTCRLRREQHLMRLRSVQADQVLGDMQVRT